MSNPNSVVEIDHSFPGLQGFIKVNAEHEAEGTLDLDIFSQQEEDVYEEEVEEFLFV